MSLFKNKSLAEDLAQAEETYSEAAQAIVNGSEVASTASKGNFPRTVCSSRRRICACSASEKPLESRALAIAG